jgi:histidyl-tRNA synthetase
MFRKISGTKDILPEEVVQWQNIEVTARKIFSFYNYKEIRSPLIEEADLFNRSLGESTEIVQKQMFLVKNKEDLYALRPEGTASVVRAYIENNLDKKDSFVKFYYIGPMFRLERPQKGRLRQFHHLGCEVIGSGDPFVDVEIISLANSLLKGLGVSDYKIKINSLGCTKDKLALAENLRKNLQGQISKLCDDCKVRFDKNILRVLDCKNEVCQEVVRKLNWKDTCLCQECNTHFNRVKDGLDTLGLDYEITPYLVRGLDYYTGTVFEITHHDLGAQDALGAGGRYDNLVAQLDGPKTGAIGFAFGLERLLLVMAKNTPKEEEGLVYLISLGEEAKRKGIQLLNNLRKAGIICDMDYKSKSLKGAMRSANDLKARYVLIIGEDELKKNVVTLKDMRGGEQKEVKLEDLIKELKC